MGNAGEDGALAFGIAADGYNVIENTAFFEKVEDTLRLFAGKVESLFLHHFDHQWIDGCSGFQPGAFNMDAFAADSELTDFTGWVQNDSPRSVHADLNRKVVPYFAGSFEKS